MLLLTHPPLSTHTLSTGPRRQRGNAQRSRLVVTTAGGDGGKSSERQPWEFGRFLQTVFFFNPPPSPAAVLQSVFKGMAGPGAAAASSGAASGVVQTLIDKSGGGGSSSEGVVLVTGATGGTGKRVVAKLLAQGRTVRALARDAGKAATLLASLPCAAGGRLELVAADITQPATLLPDMFAGVRQVVCCTAVKVQPKEGDTPDRQKYLQVGWSGGGREGMRGHGACCQVSPPHLRP